MYRERPRVIIERYTLVTDVSTLEIYHYESSYRIYDSTSTRV
jgi:hypothetical protein